tara:strand:+ start:301 stop:945 length:645 start_codon:yes stop_codon:yes gene_type:complete
MSSPFQKSFNSKSPLKGHRKIQRQINRAKRNWDGPGDFYEEHADLYEAKTKAEAAHSNARTEEGAYQVREDEDAARNSAAEMSSPLHGYREASDMVDSNPPTAHMWTRVFDSFGKLAQSIIDKRSTPEARAKHLAKRDKRRSKRRENNKDNWSADRLKRFDDRSENVKSNLTTANEAVESKKKNQETYDAWLTGEGANATAVQKANKKESLGLT